MSDSSRWPQGCYPTERCDRMYKRTSVIISRLVGLNLDILMLKWTELTWCEPTLPVLQFKGLMYSRCAGAVHDIALYIVFIPRVRHFCECKNGHSPRIERNGSNEYHPRRTHSVYVAAPSSPSCCASCTCDWYRLRPYLSKTSRPYVYSHAKQ